MALLKTEISAYVTSRMSDSPLLNSQWILSMYVRVLLRILILVNAKYFVRSSIFFSCVIVVLTTVQISLVDAKNKLLKKQREEHDVVF